MQKDREQQITEIVKEVLDELGLRLYDIHFNHITMMIRVFIDRECGSITIADCKKVNQKVLSALDRDEAMRAVYSLEVSSPGIERQLKRPEHFEWAVGKMIELSVGKEKIRGYLRDAGPDGIVVATDSGEQFIEFVSIMKANVVEEVAYGKRR